MRILILGGGSFVGRAIVEAAVSRSHEVTTFTRSTLPPGAEEGLIETVFGDRTQEGAFNFAENRHWDAVFDTWMGAPRIVQQGVAVLREHARYYSLVSSCSVYEEDPPPAGLTEDSRTVSADPSAESTDYAANKRGAELAVIDGFGVDASFVARPGIILGPHENVGRLPWWLARIALGGEVLAPGPGDLALQYIDARDLAEWMVQSAERAISGIFNAISPLGHTTIAELLQRCLETTKADADLTWLPPDFLEEQGIEQWTEMPLWVAPDYSGMFKIDTSRAAVSGLVCRPSRETVADTWDWMQNEGPILFPVGKTPLGINSEKERATLNAWASRGN